MAARIQLAGQIPAPSMRSTIIGLLANGGQPGTLTLHADGTPVPIYASETAPTADTSGTFVTDSFGMPPGWIDISYVGQQLDYHVPPANPVTVTLGAPLTSVAFLTGSPADDVYAIAAGTGIKIPPGITPLSTGASVQDQVPAYDALLGVFRADAGVYSRRGDRSLTVVNWVADPRGTVSANFAAVASGAGALGQAATQRADGYQQQATPKSCQEIIATPDSAAGHYVGLATTLAANGLPIHVNLAAPMVSTRRAAKISGSLGSSWYAALVVRYFDASNSLLQEVVVWTGVPALDTWFVAEGCDAQAPAGTDHVETSLRVYGSTAGHAVTIRCTEFVVALDTDGDIPGYVGGDVKPGGTWIGTADHALSQVSFDPVAVYPAKDFGFNDPIAYGHFTTLGQDIALQRELGSTVTRLGLGFFIGGGGGPPIVKPAVDAAHHANVVTAVKAGLKVILAVPNPPSWMCSNGDTSGLTIPDQFLSTYAQAYLDEIAAISSDAGVPPSSWLAGCEVWNEPNLEEFNVWINTLSNSAAVAKYVGLLNAVYTAFKAVYPTIPVLGGVISCSFTGSVAATSIDPVEFYNDMVSQGAQFDLLDLHPYPSGPSTGPPATGWTGLNTGMTLGFDRALGQMKDAMRAGADTRQIYVTETGLLSTIPVASLSTTAGQPGERAQAQVVSMILGRLLRDPQIAGVTLHTIIDTYTGFFGDWGMVDTLTLRRRPVAHQITKMRGKPAQPPSYSEMLRIQPPADSYVGQQVTAAPGPVVANANTVGQVMLGANGSSFASLLFGQTGPNADNAIGISRFFYGPGTTNPVLSVGGSTDFAGTVRANSMGTALQAGVGVSMLYNPTLSIGFIFSYDATNNAWKPLALQGRGILAQGEDTATATLTVLQIVSQTADSQQWQNSSASILAKVTASGSFDTTKAVRATGTEAFSSGAGAELVYLGGNAVLQGFDRGASAWKAVFLKGAGLNLANQAAASVAAVIQGASGQSVDLLQIQNSSGTPLLNVDSTGKITQYEYSFSAWKETGRRGVALVGSGVGSNTFVFTPFNPAATVGVLGSGAAGSAIGAFYLDPADQAAGSRAVKLRIKACEITNAVSPGLTFTVQLSPVSSWGGASGANPSATPGAQVAQVVLTTPAAGGPTTPGVSSSFTLSSAGWYVPLLVTSGGTAATGSETYIGYELQYQQS